MPASGNCPFPWKTSFNIKQKNCNIHRGSASTLQLADCDPSRETTIYLDSKHLSLSLLGEWTVRVRVRQKTVIFQTNRSITLDFYPDNSSLDSLEAAVTMVSLCVAVLRRAIKAIFILVNLGRVRDWLLVSLTWNMRRVPWRLFKFPTGDKTVDMWQNMSATWRHS